tara:strand:+ start:2892 stop:4076 length:1185 start_codon:yes stop_codon:yes gene_type:complete
MGFLNASFIAGAAERASEIMQEERENTQKIVDASMKFWTETGIANYKERQSNRKNLSMQFDTLSNNGFTADQIEVIAREGGVEKVLSHIETMRSEGQTVKASDIVRFSPDYKDTGRTKEQVLNSVMGKINRGMDVADAIQDVTGGKRGFLGQNLDKVAQKSAEAFSTAFGMDMSELRALATDDITIEESPVSGQLFLANPVAKARAEQALRGSETGARSFSSASTYMRNYGYAITGGTKAGINSVTGDTMYTPDIESKGIQVDEKVSELMAKRAEETGRNQFTPGDMVVIEGQLREWSTGQGYAMQPSTQSGQPNSAQTVQQPPNAGMGVYGGMTSSSIQAQAIRDAQGVSVRNKALILEQAKNAIIKDLEKSMTPADAAAEAERIIDQLESKI